MAEIGATLREARMRARIDVSEIEAQTKIRAKYLRALENEEWDLLPGPTFVKSFLRTYAQALGLDGRAVVEEYKLHYEHPGEGVEPIQQPPASAQRWTRKQTTDRRPASTAARRRGKAGAHQPRPPRQGPSRAYIATVSAVGVVIVLLVYALLSSGGSSQSPTASTPAARRPHRAASKSHAAHNGAATKSTTTTTTLASLKLEPSAEVYVCLIGDGRIRIPGEILTPTSTLPTYHARRFELTLGNNAVALVVNGAPHTVPASAQAIGYTITRAGITTLPANEQPTCK